MSSDKQLEIREAIVPMTISDAKKLGERFFSAAIAVSEGRNGDVIYLSRVKVAEKLGFRVLERHKTESQPVAPAPTSGPGTELKRLLKLVGITASPTCSCNARAREMDAKGCDWCEDNLDTIVGWLREEATKRKLPFVDMAGRMLVKRAIRNARKAAS